MQGAGQRAWGTTEENGQGREGREGREGMRPEGRGGGWAMSLT